MQGSDDAACLLYMLGAVYFYVPCPHLLLLLLLLCVPQVQQKAKRRDHEAANVMPRSEIDEVFRSS
jgi:hypothetical protein